MTYLHKLEKHLYLETLFIHLCVVCLKLWQSRCNLTWIKMLHAWSRFSFIQPPDPRVCSVYTMLWNDFVQYSIMVRYFDLSNLTVRDFVLFNLMIRDFILFNPTIRQFVLCIIVERDIVLFNLLIRELFLASCVPCDIMFCITTCYENFCSMLHYGTRYCLV